MGSSPEIFTGSLPRQSMPPIMRVTQHQAYKRNPD